MSLGKINTGLYTYAKQACAGLLVACALFFSTGAIGQYSYSNALKSSYSFSAFLNGTYDFADPNYFLGNGDSMKTDPVKYKSEITTSYSSADSGLDNKRLVSVETEEYNNQGYPTSVMVKDSMGKIISSSVNTYNGKGDLIEDVTYDTLHRITNDMKYTYDEKNMLTYYLEKSYTYEILGNCLTKVRDTIEVTDRAMVITYNSINKVAQIDASISYGVSWATTVTSYTYKYDKAKNLINISIAEKYTGDQHEDYIYDNDRNLISNMRYDSNGLVHSTITVIDKDKGTRTVTDEIFKYKTNEGSCIPDHRKVISVYDKDYNPVSEFITALESEDTTTTLTTYTYKTVPGQTLTVTSVTEENGDMYYSKKTDITTSYYDADSNVIKSVHKGGGEYGGNSTTLYIYNKKHKMIQEENYGSCMDAPTSTTKISYYPDDITTKEYRTIESYEAYFDKYDEHSNLIESTELRKGNSNQTIYTYVY
jgi:hypothetical protein